MIHEFQVRALPHQAVNEQALKRFVADEKGWDIRTINAVRVLRRSIDARQRTIFINLSLLNIESSGRAIMLSLILI